jgi:ABC-type nitrate/sulfonate/bicarbonate transport system ATPase subunit
MENKITVEKVSKTLDGLHILDDISLYLGVNEIVVVLGPSGCGKSTLLNIISGLLRPDTGIIRIDGQDWTGRTGRISYMQQKDLLLDSLILLDNISVPLIIKGMPREKARQEVLKYLSDFGLAGFENYYPRQLSGGMRQRAALLRSYLFANDILLLDEPFASLDAITRSKMHKWLLNLHKRLISSILFITHDIEEALLLADRIYILGSRPACVKQELKINQPAKNTNELKHSILAVLEEESNNVF